MPPDSAAAPPNSATPSKAPAKATGIRRVWLAFGYSLSGLRLGMGEAAFRQEMILGLIFFPAAFFLGQTWVERSILLLSLFLVLITELINTAIESAIDRIGYEIHPLSKRAKDIGSATVLLAMLFLVLCWGMALYARFA